MSSREGVPVLMDRRKCLYFISLTVISMGLAGSPGGSVRAAGKLRVGWTGPPAAWKSVSQSGRYRLWGSRLRSDYETEFGAGSEPDGFRARCGRFVSQYGRERLWFKDLRSNYETGSGRPGGGGKFGPWFGNR